MRIKIGQETYSCPDLRHKKVQSAKPEKLYTKTCLALTRHQY